jgi:hypothetical protein
MTFLRHAPPRSAPAVRLPACPQREVAVPYRVHGSVVEDESGRPLAGLVVRAYDEDLVIDDHLGDARTDAQGHFEVVFTEVQFMDLFETRPDLYLRVFDASGDRLLLTTEREVRSDAELDERFELRIPRERLAER